jgi:hypothetical protein
MLVIPVLDLRGSVVVHARAGERARLPAGVLCA